jgi:hypothetical protein
MTLRLSAAETEALRLRARLERTSMQELAKRALGIYLDAHSCRSPLDAVLDEELDRYAGAVQALRRWRD